MPVESERRRATVSEATRPAADQLTSITYKQGTSTLGDLTYGYDQAGRRSTVVRATRSRAGRRQIRR